MLTLFVMLTLENFPIYMDAAMEVEPWAWLYFVSFILVAAFIVLNVLIGVVLNSMEEAREIDRRQALRERYGVTRPSPIDPEAHAPSRSESRSSATLSTSWSSSSRSGRPTGIG